MSTEKPYQLLKHRGLLDLFSALTLDEYLKKKQLLQTPCEQSRLLLEIPDVIADEIEEEARPQEGNNASPKSIFWEAIEISGHDLVSNQTLLTQNSDRADAAGASLA